MKCGLIFQFGPCEKDSKGRHIHPANFIVSGSPFPLFDCQNDVDLFRTYKPSLPLLLDDHQIIPKMGEWDKLNYFLFAVKEITDAQQISTEWFQELHLSDLNDSENYFSYILISALIKKDRRLFPEFRIYPGLPRGSGFIKKINFKSCQQCLHLIPEISGSGIL